MTVPDLPVEAPQACAATSTTSSGQPASQRPIDTAAAATAFRTGPPGMCWRATGPIFCPVAGVWLYGAPYLELALVPGFWSIVALLKRMDGQLS